MGHLTQTHYKQFHHDVFDADGEFVQEKWDAWDGPSMELCSMAMTKFNFSLAIVFLWSGRMLGELRNIDRLHRDIYAIQGLGEDSDISDMVKDVEGDEGEATGSRVVALTTVARVSTYVLIIIPKVIIAMVLLALGCRWLASTESFADLILNALALEFVIGIDELMYESFVPEAMRLRLEASTVVHKKANRGTDDAKTESAIEFTRNTYSRSSRTSSMTSISTVMGRSTGTMSLSVLCGSVEIASRMVTGNERSECMFSRVVVNRTE